MQPYRHPHGPHLSADDGRPVDLYGLPALPPDEPVPRPAPWRPASSAPRRRGPHDSADRVAFPDRRVRTRARIGDLHVPARARVGDRGAPTRARVGDRGAPTRARIGDRHAPTRARIVWLGVAGGVVVTAASAAVGAMAAQAVAGLF